MQDKQSVIDTYNKTAPAYAAKFFDELKHKRLDRLLLNAFADENKNRGTCIDLGCGPGQTTRYLHGQGMKNILGTDISPEMVRIARDLNPDIRFEVADLLELPYPTGKFAAAIAFYAIVHFDTNQVRLAFGEVNRVLKTGGDFLLSFHVGPETIHLDHFLDQPVSIDFHFFDLTQVKTLLGDNGFEITECVVREAYTGIEYPSQRAYIWVRKRN